MRKKVLARMLTSALLTVAMVTTMGMTAFAEGEEGGSGSQVEEQEETEVEEESGSSSDTITISKTIDAGENAQYIVLPEATYTFTVAPADVEDETTETYTVDENSYTLPVYAGEADAVTDGTVVWDETKAVDSNGDAVSETGTITFDASAFSKPGIYRYTVSEDTTGLPTGMSASDTEYTLDVYVLYNDDEELYVAAIIASTEDSEEKATELEFENTYTTYTVTVTKVVAGNAGDKTKSFEFGIQSDKNITMVDENGKITVIEKNDEQIFSLADGESVTFYGLLGDAVAGYDLYESDDSVLDGEYVMTAVRKLNGEEDSSFEAAGLEDNWFGNRTLAFIDELAIGNGDINYQNVDVEYIVTNTAEVSTPTGVILTFAPYILLVGFAGILAVLFFRKREEQL